jgi:predicted nucleic acid-binding protein
VSAILFEEIARSPEDLRERLEEEVSRARPEVLRITEDIETLARQYVEAKAVSQKYIDDARHIAAASYWSVDAVVSWNFRHMVNLQKKHLYQSVNLREGHRLIDIISPPEVPYV